MSKPEGNDGRAPIKPGDTPRQRELVDPKWLLKAGGLTLLAAVIVAYLAFCALFYQGQWQFVLHPGPMEPVPDKLLPPRENVRFAVDSGGQPTMFAWWIPADQNASMANDVLVYFPGGTGALSSHTENLTYLHRQQITIFAFDYRGYGDSAKIHPSQSSMAQDGVAAVQYLTQTRHIPLNHIVLYGEAIGCLPALHAAAENPGVAAVILSDPEMSQRPVFDADARTHLLPLDLLLRDDFSLARDLPNLRARTLEISTLTTQQSREEAQQVFAKISAPKQLLQAPAAAGANALTSDLDAFLLQVFPTTATPTVPGNGPATTQRREK